MGELTGLPRRRVRIRLYGKLRRALGKEFSLLISSAAEAIRLLEANFPGRLYPLLREGDYVVVNGPTPRAGVNLYEQDHFRTGLSHDTLHIIPIAAGAGGKSGLWTAIAGVLLLGAVGIFTLGSGLGIAGLGMTAEVGGLSLGVTWGTLGLVGLGLITGGLLSLLAPAQESDKSRANFFNGPINSTTQGGCVPVVYGRTLCGSTVISAQLIAVPTSGATSDPSKSLLHMLGLDLDDKNKVQNHDMMLAATKQPGYTP